MSRGPRHAVVEAKLPVVQVEIRPGRTIAVHHHCPSSQAAPRARLFFVHGSCGSMLQYEALVCNTGLDPQTSRPQAGLLLTLLASPWTDCALCACGSRDRRLRLRGLRPVAQAAELVRLASALPPACVTPPAAQSGQDSASSL